MRCGPEVLLNLFLVLSSHMDFEPEWDERMIEMWDLTQNEYAVLSTYVANIGECSIVSICFSGAHTNILCSHHSNSFTI